MNEPLIFGFIAISCGMLISATSSSLLALYEYKRIVPEAIFKQFRDEMTYPRKLFYLAIMRDHTPILPKLIAYKDRNAVIAGILIISFFMCSLTHISYYQRSTAAIGALVTIIAMLLISRFWTIRRRLFMLKAAASLKNAPRKGRDV